MIRTTTIPAVLTFCTLIGACSIFDERSRYVHPVNHPDGDNPKTHSAAVKDWRKCWDDRVTKEQERIALGSHKKVQNPDYGKGAPICDPTSNPISCGQATGAYAGSSNSSLYISKCSCNAECEQMRDATDAATKECMAEKGWELRHGYDVATGYYCSKSSGPESFTGLHIPREQ